MLQDQQINDVIVEIGGVPVTSIDELLSVLRTMRAGQLVDARILRVDDDRVLTVELGRLEP